MFMCYHQGKGFTVQTHYLEEPASDYLRTAVSTILAIHDQVLCSLWFKD